jgi:predicted transcriptional regulator of viral defense system
MTPLPETYAGAQGLALLGGLDDRAKLVFSTADAVEAGFARSVSARQVSQVLLRLEAAGWIRRIKRGLYAVTGKLPGSSAPHDYVIATALHAPSALSHLTALHLHELSEQVPRIIMCTTTAKVVTPSMRSGQPKSRRRGSTWEVDGLEIQYVSVRPKRFFGIEEVWVDERSRVSVTDRERTVLDLFADPPRAGGFGQAVGVLEAHHQGLDLAKLVSYAVRFGVTAVAKRLGWALEAVGVGGDLLLPLLAVPAKGLQALDPQRPRRGTVVARWRLIDNLGPGRPV